MMIIWIIIGMILGAVMGSFACCQARRLRRQEEGKQKLGKWSVCEKCKRRLTVAENIPIFSWIMQRGRCRHCGTKIGLSEIMSEVAMMVVFGILFAIAYREMSPLEGFELMLAGVRWLLILIAMVAMWVVVVYDAKWGEMPVGVLMVANVCAILFAVIEVCNPMMDNGNLVFKIDTSVLLNFGISLLILPGLYLALCFLSRETLVGGGDWLLALAIALFLQNWWLAFFELFFSNALASVVAFWLILKERKKKKLDKTMSLKIPFGPYLVVAFVIVLAFEPFLVKMIVF